VGIGKRDGVAFFGGGFDRVTVGIGVCVVIGVSSVVSSDPERFDLLLGSSLPTLSLSTTEGRKAFAITNPANANKIEMRARVKNLSMMSLIISADRFLVRVGNIFFCTISLMIKKKAAATSPARARGVETFEAISKILSMSFRSTNEFFVGLQLRTNTNLYNREL